MSESKAIAKQKLQNALKYIEAAQNHLSSACGELSRLEGAYDQWKAVGDKYDEIKELWRMVNETTPRNSIDLDSDAKAKLAGKY